MGPHEFILLLQFKFKPEERLLNLFSITYAPPFFHTENLASQGQQE